MAQKHIKYATHAVVLDEKRKTPSTSGQQVRPQAKQPRLLCSNAQTRRDHAANVLRRIGLSKRKYFQGISYG